MKTKQEPTLFIGLLKNAGLPLPEAEYRFYPKRKWRFDFAWPKEKVAVEQEGGTWTNHSRHTRGSGFLKDCEKYNKAALLGWKVLRYAPDQLLNEAIRDLKEILKCTCQYAALRAVINSDKGIIHNRNCACKEIKK